MKIGGERFLREDIKNIKQQNKHLNKHEYAPRKLPWGVCIIFNIVRITDLVMVCDGITGRDIQNIAQKN